jgi:hypothetical protein
MNFRSGVSNVESRCSAVGIATGYTLDDRGVRVSSPGRVNNFHFSILSRPALELFKPPMQWVPEALCPGCKAAGPS